MEATAAKVVVSDLHKRYGDVRAAQGVSFQIRDGEIFGLLGPNGSGKTTTVECLLGLREPDSGSIAVCGIDARRHPRDARQKLGAALQTTSLQDKITPREALRLFGAFYGHRATPDEMIGRFGLETKADAAFDTLSGGQRQRLALALAFVNRPEVVVLDEPTTGLDPQSRRELHGEIARMKQDGHTVLLTTHYIEEAEQLCDRIAVIDRGRIIATGTPHELIARSSAMQSVSIATAPPLTPADLSQLDGAEDIDVEGARLRFRTTTVGPTLAGLLRLVEARGVEIAELQVRKATLEDVFLELTGSGAGAGE
ncbi:MAG: ABC transporter ATP-binding protein [Acidobacteriota bacterium]